MKFALPSAALSLLAFVTSVAAQASYINYPKPGTEVTPGQNVTVQVVRPISIMGSIEVGLVLSFQYCPPPNPCPNAVNQLGFVLHVGKLNPVFHERPGEPYENFTITIPDYEFDTPSPAEIIETRFHLIGAGPAPVLESNTVALELVDHN